MQKDKTNSSRSFWSRLNDPQSAVLAAAIAAVVSLVAAGISIWSTVYTNSMSKELANHNTNLSYRKEQSDKTFTAFDEALKAIRNMKNQIQNVIAEKNITVENADKILREASKKLDESYATYGSAITASDFFIAKVFHGTKSPGRRAWNNLEGENEQTISKVSGKSKQDLEMILGELSTAETNLQDKYDALRANPNILN